MNTAFLTNRKTSLFSSPYVKNSDATVVVGNQKLTIDEVVNVARHSTLR